ncbi:hypothetical protein ACFW2V_14000 [Streptomyces sp. NPDC058947]|uniref:hypothetical protein n=1 Tax=Streptomyces sp. NPDC058947 TaxID=3346675 RepID=UPI0036B580CA
MVEIAWNGQHPQPHEGVEGGALPEGHLLALTEEAIARRLEMISQTWRRWGDILHARIDGRDALFERMYSPRVGDLVIEQTTSFRRDPISRVQACGLLLIHERKEWASTDIEWAQVVAEEKESHETSDLPFDAERFAQRERVAENATYIQYGASAVDICRWSNCKFIAIPEDIAEQFTQG